MAATFLVVHHTTRAVLDRDRWRLRHQTRALVSHYKRRGDPIPIHLLL